jgi:hypothetical protein
MMPRPMKKPVQVCVQPPRHRGGAPISDAIDQLARIAAGEAADHSVAPDRQHVAPKDGRNISCGPIFPLIAFQPLGGDVAEGIGFGRAAMRWAFAFVYELARLAPGLARGGELHDREAAERVATQPAVQAMDVHPGLGAAVGDAQR